MSLCAPLRGSTGGAGGETSILVAPCGITGPAKLHGIVRWGEGKDTSPPQPLAEKLWPVGSGDLC